MKLTIKFTKLDAVNKYTHRRYTSDAWKECAENLINTQAGIPIYSGNSMSGCSMIGVARCNSFSWPEVTFDAVVYEPHELFAEAILTGGFAVFTAEGYVECDANDPNISVVKSLKLVCINMVTDQDPFGSVLTLVEDEPGPFCARCGEAINTPFLYIIEYRDKLYHEDCFFELAIETLQAKTLQLDSSGKIEDASNESSDDNDGWDKCWLM